uniref:ROX1 homologue n=1 Tax=Nicotiana benthamiana TaxID=4100 RepID=I7HAV8_NICBE|nr:ROX1 homologue [Nicotiana benthamiana]
MAPIAKHFSLIFLLILLSSLQIHARDGQFFNKVSRNNGEKQTQTVIPNKEQEPNFMPENENGAYGHDSVTTPNTNNPTVHDLPISKYLPKNYNPVSYVTVPEDNTNENDLNNNEFTTKHTTTTTTASNNNQFYSGPTAYGNNNNNNQQQYYNGVSDYSTTSNNQQKQQQFYSGDNFYSNNQQQQQDYNGGNTYNNNDNNNEEEEEYYNNNGGNTYNNNNNEQQEFSETRLSARTYSTNPTNYGNNYNNNNQEQSYSTNYNNYNTGKSNYRVHQQQGMSDTRFLGNGKFYYDINAEKHARDPYENAREFAAMNQQYNNRNTYGNNEYSINNNRFENEEEFQVEDNMP